MNIEDVKLLGSLAVAGTVVALGKLLSSDEKLKPRQIAGRAITSATLGVIAGAAVVFIPGISFVAQVALACAMSSLGTSAVEALFARVVKK
jgi:hypothetical protein